MAPITDRLKSNYALSLKVEPFYTGGRVQVTSDGNWLLCQCGNQIQVVDAKFGKIEHSLKQENDEVVTFALGPDSLTLVSSHKSSLLRHWRWNDGTVVRTWKSLHKTPVVELAFDPTTTLVASGGTDGSLKVWDICKQYCTHNLKGGSGVYSLVKFHSEAKTLTVYGASLDGKIRCWDLKTSNLISTLEGHFSAVTGLTFFSSLNQAVSCGRDKVLILWDLDKKTAIRTVPTFESIEAVVAVPSTEDGGPLESLNIRQTKEPHVITAGDRGCLRVWNMNASCQVYEQKDSSVSRPELEGAPAITQLEFNKANSALYVVTFDHNIIVHNINNFSLLKQFAGYNDDILDIAWFGKGETHLAVATNSHHVKVYEVETMNCTLLKGHTDLVMALATSKVNFDVLITSSKDKTIRVWQMLRSPFRIACIAHGHAHTGSVGAVSLSRTELSFIVTGSQDTCLKLWKLTQDQLVRVDEEQNRPEESKANDQDRAVGEESKALSVLCTAVAHDKDINAVCVSPNDKLIATGSQDKTAKIWDSSNLALIGVLRGHRRGLWAVQFSPADQVLASGSTDGTVKLWSLADHSCLKTLEGHESSVLRLHFVAKGHQLVTAASDGLVKLWTIKSSECVATMDAHTSKVWALTVRSDDSALASGAGDATMIIWKDVTKEERESSAQEKEKRVLEEQQLANLMRQGLLLDALALAIELDQPFRTLNILKELMDRGSTDSCADLTKKISTLADGHKDSLVRYASSWNTNSRHCHQAQLILSIMIRNHTPEELLRFPSMKGALAGFIMYSERHMQRLNRLRQNSSILTYTAAQIQATQQE